MKVVVCVRQGLDGVINPFDASAYETALRLPNAKVTLLSMGPLSVKDFLLHLTRLGAKRAILLNDKAFAGADTLATAYTLSLAINELNPDLILCGRQTLIGDTGQTGPMLSVLCNRNFVSNVMHLEKTEDSICCLTRDDETVRVVFPALLTVERVYNLRLPSILSKLGQVEIWDAGTLCADLDRCGLKGSPTRVLQTFENHSGKRNCQFIQWTDLQSVISQALRKSEIHGKVNKCKKTLKKVCVVGETPIDYAQTVSNNIVTLPISSAEELVQQIQKESPTAVLWGSDALSKTLAASVSAKLGLGLCADCTALEADDDVLVMYRPALSGSLIAKIVSHTRPAMATVRTTGHSNDIVVAAGWGVRGSLDAVSQFAESLQAEMAASRKMVDSGFLP